MRSARSRTWRGGGAVSITPGIGTGALAPFALALLTACAGPTVDPTGTGSGDSAGDWATADDEEPWVSDGADEDDGGCGDTKPKDGRCDNDADCCSDSCFPMVLLPGLCGECKEDADCPQGGCSLPVQIPEYERGAVCNRGERGAGCQTDAACQTGLTCELVFDSMVLETVYRGCSECSSDGDCGPGEVCGLEMSPFEAQRGQRLCQPQGSVLNGGSCTSLDTDGDLACASGRCGPAFAGVLFTLEVCGDCRVDADCPEGQTCSAGAVQDGFVTGPTCTPT